MTAYWPPARAFVVGVLLVIAVGEASALCIEDDAGAVLDAERRLEAAHMVNAVQDGR